MPKAIKRVSSHKLICYFGQTKTEGTKEMKLMLGGKGANLAEMTSIGLPVPPGFTITTQACKDYNDAGKKFPAGLMDEVKKNLATLEKETGKKLGSASNPLLVSVRSGAAVSMPGMMDTVLNLGLTDEAVEGLAKLSGNRRFALDAYRRLINMFGDVVMGVDHHHYETAFDKVKKKYKVKEDTQLGLEGLEELVAAYKQVYKKYTKEEFPQIPLAQLEKSIQAVFNSWNADRAIKYRYINEITGLLGTAVNVQTMVFGNMGADSGTGVALTRDPSTGKNTLYGEFLVNAQGEDVVAGIRTPQPIAEMRAWKSTVYRQLLSTKKILEDHYRDVQDLEFTIERDKLFILQTRNSKRTGAAAVKIACDMVKEKLITEKEAVLRVPPGDLNQLLFPSFDPKAKRDVLTIGLPASPGAACGRLSFTASDAAKRTSRGEAVILVREETSPEDVEGMHAARGILTKTGQMISQAAVVARGWGKPCVCGVRDIHINEKKQTITVGGRTFTHADTISIDGASGEVMAGEVATQDASLSGDFATLMKWADKYRKLGVRTNADTPDDAQRARNFGAAGIGLCRTEHMFFEGERIVSIREMILANTEKARRKALKKLLPFQRKDFIGIFTTMKGLPVTVRLLDPPLHEFLPHDEKSQQDLAQRLGIAADDVRNRVDQLHEMNPMLGHRGCRLAVTYPEILEMQVTAIVEAAIECKKKKIDAQPEIMIPLVGSPAELAMLRQRTLDTIDAVKAGKKYTGKFDIPVGTMIEIPRAALTADELAKYADFFSFGTNDLTQTTFGYSRDDVNTFLPDYLEQELLEKDPFQSLDVTGVGQLVEMGVVKGRSTSKDLKCGICGEHGGDPASIAFCNKVGLDYVSCSPFRVPIARLAAAQAAISADMTRRSCPKRLRKKTILREPTGRVIAEHRVSGGLIWDLATTSDEVVVACACSDGRIRLLNCENGRVGQSFSTGQLASSLSVLTTGKIAAAGGGRSVVIWNPSGKRRKTRLRFAGNVDSVAWCSDARRIAACLNNGNVILRTIDGHQPDLQLSGHTHSVRQIAMLGRAEAVTCSVDENLRLWDVFSSDCRSVLLGHKKAVNSIAVRPHRRQVLSGSEDWTIRLWDVDLALSVGVFEGHEAAVSSVTVSPNGRYLASASEDQTVRLWDIDSAVCVYTIKLNAVPHVIRFNTNGSRLFLSGETGGIVILDTNSLSKSPAENELGGVRYSNAKVVLLGESRIGKSCLSERLVKNEWVECESTHGLRVMPMSQLSTSKKTIEREVWLWDLAGQPDYRLIHQLFLDHTSLALVLYDPTDPNPFRYLPDWEKALRIAVRGDSPKILVAAKVDQSGKTVAPNTAFAYSRDHGYVDHVATSARTGQGRAQLLDVMRKHIPWGNLTAIATRTHFKAIKDAILKQQHQSSALIELKDLENLLRDQLGDVEFTNRDLNSVITLMGNENIIRQLNYGRLILLRPEMINNYASALIRSASDYADEIGGLDVHEVLEGRFDMTGVKRLPGNEERVLLPAVIQLFQSRSLCIVTKTDDAHERIIFPLQGTREWENTPQLKKSVEFAFAGHVRTIFATLVVQIAYSNLFHGWQLWRDAVVYQTKHGAKVAISLDLISEGQGKLIVLVDPCVDEDAQAAVMRYVQDHLSRQAADVRRRRFYVCSTCRRLWGDGTDADRQLQEGVESTRCHCGNTITFLDVIEHKCDDERFQQYVRDLRDLASIAIDNRSKDMILVGEMTALAGQAGQIFRATQKWDVGIDGEFEFCDEKAIPTGGRVYVQLKHGDSYLRHRDEDGKLIFDVKNDRHLNYWCSHKYPVYLVIRASNGNVEWMNITEYLRKQLAKKSRQIVFTGEPLNKYALIRLRNLHRADAQVTCREGH